MKVRIDSEYGLTEQRVSASRWFDPAWMRLTPELGYQPIGAFGLKDSHLTPGFADWGFYHDLAHALHAIHGQESWRLQEADFGLRYTTAVVFQGETFYEPQTTRAVEMEMEVLALQAWLMRLEEPMRTFDVHEWALSRVRLLRFMDDFLMYVMALPKENGRTCSNDSAFHQMAAQVVRYYESFSPAGIHALWQTLGATATSMRSES